MNFSSVRHSYVLKKDKHDKEKAVIYHRIKLIVNGRKVKTLEISSRLTVTPTNWDGKIKGKSCGVHEDNDDLETQRMQIKNLFKSEVTKSDFDPDIFKMTIQGQVMGIEHIAEMVKDIRKPKTIIGLFDEYLKNYETQRSARRVKLYKFAQKQLSNYLKNKFSSGDCEVQRLRRDDFIAFQNYLSQNRGKNTVVSYMKALKAVVNDAVKAQKITHTPFVSCVTSFRPGNRKPLTMEEVQRIADIPISELTQRENISRWVFVFGCFTGLSYSDLVKLEEGMISVRHDGLVININRTKTDEAAVIPRNDELETILKMFVRYHAMQPDRKRLLPVPSYNKYNNEDLKAIQQKADIKKNISTHIVRNTFATYWLDRGGSYEALSKILGHRKIATTQLYGNVGTERVMNEAKLVFAGETLKIDNEKANINISQAYLQKHLSQKGTRRFQKADKISYVKTKGNGRANKTNAGTASRTK